MADMRGALALAVLILVFAAGCGDTDPFPPGFDAGDFHGSTIDNTWYSLSPGTTFVYRGVKDGKEARDVVTGILADIAPEADLTEIDPAAELQPQLDIDSLDFLRFVEGIVERTGLPVPEQDYQQVATLDGAVAYVRARAGDARP